MTAKSRKTGPVYVLTLVIATVIAIVIGLGASPVLGATPVTVKVKVLMSGPPVKFVPAGVDKAHMVGIGQYKGKALFSDGRKAEYSNVFFFDLYRGKFAKALGYTKMTFKDGSWLFFKWDSAFIGRDKAGNPMMAGTGIIQRGGGAYEGIQGTAKFKNRRIPPNKDFPKGGTEANAEFTYTLPEKK